MMSICLFQSSGSSDTAELFVNCLEKAMMVESCLPGDDLDILNPYPSSLGISSNLNLSSSMSSLSVGSMHSPTDKDIVDKNGTNGGRIRHASANNLPTKNRAGSFKQKEKKKLMEPIEWDVDKHWGWLWLADGHWCIWSVVVDRICELFIGWWKSCDINHELWWASDSEVGWFRGCDWPKASHVTCGRCVRYLKVTVTAIVRELSEVARYLSWKSDSWDQRDVARDP